MPTKVDANLKTEEYWDTFMATFRANTLPMIRKLNKNLDRCMTPLEMIYLPSLIAIGLINWPYAFFYKIGTFLSASVLSFRVFNKI